MGLLLSVALGGVIGALGRYGLTVLFSGVYTIMMINIAGSFLMGIAFAWFEYGQLMPEAWRSFVMVGLLGSFTTFSTFSAHVFHLFEQDLFLHMMSYLFLSVIGAIAAFILGFYLIRQVML